MPGRGAVERRGLSQNCRRWMNGCYRCRCCCYCSCRWWFQSVSFTRCCSYNYTLTPSIIWLRWRKTIGWLSIRNDNPRALGQTLLLTRYASGLAVYTTLCLYNVLCVNIAVQAVVLLITNRVNRKISFSTIIIVAEYLVTEIRVRTLWASTYTSWAISNLFALNLYLNFAPVGQTEVILF